jgi:hypothetical protein
MPMWGCYLCSNGHGRHTTRVTIVLAFWQTSENVILVMFVASWKLMNCSIYILANAEYINFASSAAALKQAHYLLCEAS